MNRRSLVLGPQSWHASHSEAVACTEEIEAALEMVRHRLCDRLVIMESFLGPDKTSVLTQYVAAFHPDCEVRIVGPGEDRPCDRTAEPPSPDAVHERRNVVVVYSVKGGTGCTTLAANLAGCLVTRVPGPVSLLDLSLPVGDVHLHFDLEPEPNLLDCLPFLDTPDASSIESMMNHHRSGLHILCGVPHARLGQLVESRQCSALINAVRTVHATTIVDVGCQPELAEFLCAQCPSICLVMVCSPDVSCLSRAQRYLNSGSLPVAPHIVLYGWARDCCVTEHEAARFLGGMQPLARIDSCPREIADSIISGSPLSIGRPDSRYAQSVSSLVQRLFDLSLPAEKTKRPGWAEKVLGVVRR